MTWIQDVHALGVSMQLAELDGEYYLTAPVWCGAVEVDEDKKVWYREWQANHGMSKENELDPVPDVPLEEQASYIRMLLIRHEHQLASRYNEEKILNECQRAIIEDREISHGTARTIAADHLDGTECISQFYNDGSIVTENLWWNMFSLPDGKPVYPLLPKDAQLVADMFGTYLTDRRKKDDIGPVENWSRMWVDKP